MGCRITNPTGQRAMIFGKRKVYADWLSDGAHILGHWDSVPWMPCRIKYIRLLKQKIDHAEPIPWNGNISRIPSRAIGVGKACPSPLRWQGSHFDRSLFRSRWYCTCMRFWVCFNWKFYSAGHTCVLKKPFFMFTPEEDIPLLRLHFNNQPCYCFKCVAHQSYRSQLQCCFYLMEHL